MVQTREAQQNAAFEEDKRRRREVLQQNAEMQKSQMRRGPSVDHSELAVRGKYQLGGMMNKEEARMNRQLLKEISEKKRRQSRE